MGLTFTPLVRKPDGEIFYRGNPQTCYSTAQEIASNIERSNKHRRLRSSVLQEGIPEKQSRSRTEQQES